MTVAAVMMPDLRKHQGIPLAATTFCRTDLTKWGEPGAAQTAPALAATWMRGSDVLEITCRRCEQTFTYTPRGGTPRVYCDSCKQAGLARNLEKHRQSARDWRAQNPGRPRQMKIVATCPRCEQPFTAAGRPGGGRSPTYCELCRAIPWHKRNQEQQRQRCRDAYAKDPEKARQRACDYRTQDPEKARQAARDYRVRNLEKVRNSDRDSRAQNPEMYRQRKHRRRARKAAAVMVDFTARQWRELLAEYDQSCAYCGDGNVGLQQEHVVPIARHGNHTKNNIVPACAPCNLSKGVRTVDVFLRDLALRGRYAGRYGRQQP